MAPIRVGLIGLGAVSGGMMAPGRWAYCAHFPSILKSPAYELVALANSTVESAQRSIDFHKLPSTVKAYGSPEDLAKDPDVDLIVVSVNVQKHLFLTKPALQSGKDVFVEWPLGASLEEAEELTKLAREAGVKTVVGAQGRASPVVSAVRKILAEGKIGKVISSHVFGCTSYAPIDFWIKGAEYYLEMKSGGNPFYISFGHFLDSFTHVLGDFKLDTLQSILDTQCTTVSVLDMETGEVVNPAYTRTAPDHIIVQGRLESGAVASISFRGTKLAINDSSIQWIISGTEGEIEITVPASSQWQVQDAQPKLRLKINKEAEVEEVDYDAELDTDHDDVAGLDRTALNIGLVYEAYRKGDTDRYPTFEDALKLHKLLHRIATVANFI
ncbi:hypothetical protein B0T24DRAFT_657769 [Lasiosphaeria ovina]|uniref:Oxidoreductase n=1 Tax=Lasiosphaeria ovina TaxID=92902 RepID=A0AAE0KDI3_9PEZI|nr:hypothetical protein B0T24DRAFT_657769 [Lasiosphaeria ovina]